MKPILAALLAFLPLGTAQDLVVPDFSKGMPDVKLEEKDMISGQEIFHLKTVLSSKEFSATLTKFLGVGWRARKLKREEMILAANKSRNSNAEVNLAVYEHAKSPGVDIRVIHLKYKKENAGCGVEIAVLGEGEKPKAANKTADVNPSAMPQKQKAGEHFSQTTEPFTIAVLPDTQFYCDTRLKLSAKWGNGDLRRYFFAQTEWVRDNQERLNIAFLVHEGDIVQADAPEEWAIAKKAMSVLDGKVPYCMCLGNHDMGFEKADNKYGGNIGVNRTTHFNTYFPREKFAKRHEFGGTFDPDRHDNSWYHFEVAGMSFLIVALECKPRDEVLGWANKTVSEHPDHRVIVLTHAYMNKGKSRNTGGMSAKGNTGEQTWQKFVKKHKNIFMVLCGHHAGEAVRTDAGDHGNQVHQILCDYQHLNNGGESWLRYMVFKPEANKISIHTYNPALDKFKNGPSSRFDLDYPMALPPVTAPGITRPGAASTLGP